MRLPSTCELRLQSSSRFPIAEISLYMRSGLMAEVNKHPLIHHGKCAIFVTTRGFILLQGHSLPVLILPQPRLRAMSALPEIPLLSSFSLPILRQLLRPPIFNTSSEFIHTQAAEQACQDIIHKHPKLSSLLGRFQSLPIHNSDIRMGCATNSKVYSTREVEAITISSWEGYLVYFIAKSLAHTFACILVERGGGSR